MATSQKLVDVLKARIAEGEDEKLLRGVERQVKKAKMASDQEMYHLDLQVDNAEENLDSVEGHPGSSLEAIVNAQRSLKLAKENQKAAKAVYSARF